MPTFRNGDVEIAFLDEGEGDPIVLVHGFASNEEVNWVQPGWVSTLTRDGRRVIALDNRGHGQSTKLYDPAAYHTDMMADDVAALIDHLSIDRADVMGYSIGARITRGAGGAASGSRALGHSRRSGHQAGRRSSGLPARWRGRWKRRRSTTSPIRRGRAFRAFAEQTQSDLPRARGVHSRFAPDAAGAKSLAIQSADAGRGRHQGRHRRLAA